jgi:hypothetical protein
MSSQYLMHVKIKTQPKTRLLGYIPIPFLYVHGNSFKISVFIRNSGNLKFNGGEIVILIKYAFGNLSESIRSAVQPVTAGEEIEVDLKGKSVWGVLAHGHSLFLVTLYEKQQTLVFVQLYNEKLEKLEHQEGGYHIHSFYSLTRGEIYTLIALYVNILLAVLLNYERLLDAFRKISDSLTNLVNWLNGFI